MTVIQQTFWVTLPKKSWAHAQIQKKNLDSNIFTGTASFGEGDNQSQALSCLGHSWNSWFVGLAGKLFWYFRISLLKEKAFPRIGSIHSSLTSAACRESCCKQTGRTERCHFTSEPCVYPLPALFENTPAYTNNRSRARTNHGHAAEPRLKK